MRGLNNVHSILATAMMIAAATKSAWAGVPIAPDLAEYVRGKAPRVTKRYPQMITASDKEIAAWNENVTTRQVLRNKWRTRA